MVVIFLMMMIMMMIIMMIFCDFCDDFCDFCDGYYHDDESVYYNKPLSDFKRLESAKNNNIVNLINNNYRHKVALLVNDYRIFICEDNRY